MNDFLSSKVVKDFSHLSEDAITTNKFTFTALTNGLGYAKTSRIYAERNVPVCSEYAYNKRLSELFVPFLDTAVLSCQKALETSCDEKIVSFDGMWCCVRNAPFHIADLFDVETSKVIDFQIVTTCELPSVKKHGNITVVHNTAANEFEGIGLSEIRSRPSFEEGTKYYVHDVDLKAKAIITKKNQDLHLIERFDFNHLIKGLFRTARTQGALYGLYGQLRSKFINTMKTVNEPSKRAEAFMNEFNNICKGLETRKKDKEENKKMFRSVMQEASEWLPFVDAKYHTNNNESLHAEISRFAPKNTVFKKSWPIRAAIGIIKKNHPDNWMIIIRNIIGAPLPDSNSIFVYKRISLKAELDRIARSKPENIEKRKLYRTKKMESKTTSKMNEHITNIALEKKKSIFSKPRLFGVAAIEFPPKWKENVFFIHDIENNYERIEQYMNIIEPLIYRINPRTASGVFITSSFHGKTDKLSLTDFDKSCFDIKLVTDDNFNEVISQVPIFETKNHLNNNILETQQRKKEDKKIKDQTKKDEETGDSYNETTSDSQPLLQLSNKVGRKVSLKKSTPSSSPVIHKQDIHERELLDDPCTDPIVDAAFSPACTSRFLTLKALDVTLIDQSSSDEEESQSSTNYFELKQSTITSAADNIMTTTDASIETDEHDCCVKTTDDDDSIVSHALEETDSDQQDSSTNCSEESDSDLSYVEIENESDVDIQQELCEAECSECKRYSYNQFNIAFEKHLSILQTEDIELQTENTDYMIEQFYDIPEFARVAIYTELTYTVYMNMLLGEDRESKGKMLFLIRKCIENVYFDEYSTLENFFITKNLIASLIKALNQSDDLDFIEDIVLTCNNIIKVFPQLSFKVANDLLPILPGLIENLVSDNEITKDSIAETCIIIMHNLLIMVEGPKIPNIHDCMHSLISLSFNIYFKEASAASKFAIACLMDHTSYYNHACMKLCLLESETLPCIMENAFNENDKNAWIILVGIIESKTGFDALLECDISSMIPAYLDKEIKESDESLNESIEYALRILNIIVNYDQGDVINEMIIETSIVDALLFIMENSGNYNDAAAEILLDMACDKEKANIMLNKYPDILYHITAIGNNGTINNIIMALLFVQYILIFVEPSCINIKEVLEQKDTIDWHQVDFSCFFGEIGLLERRIFSLFLILYHPKDDTK